MAGLGILLALIATTQLMCVSGQRDPQLFVRNLTLNASTYSDWWYSGTSTSVILIYLPQCISVRSTLSLVNINTSKVVTQRSFSSTTPLYWNTFSHDELTAADAGVYKCRSGSIVSVESFVLQIRTRPTNAPSPSTDSSPVGFVIGGVIAFIVLAACVGQCGRAKKHQVQDGGSEGFLVYFVRVRQS